MRQRRILLFLALAIAAASVAGFSTLRLLSTRPTAPARSDVAATRAVVATRNLAVGSLVTEQDVQVVAWPASPLPEGFISDPADVIGRGLIADVRANEPFLATKIAEKGSGAGLPIVIPEGMRALSISVDEVIGVAGFVLPGTRVDVLLTMQPPGQQESMTQVILQNVRALTAGQVVQRDAEGKPLTVSVVTLMVTPEQAETLTLAATQGRIQLALRNMMDVDSVTTPGIRTAALFDLSRGRAPVRRGTATARRAPAQEDNSAVVEVYKGGNKTIQRF